jgi:hypothetical protein
MKRRTAASLVQNRQTCHFGDKPRHRGDHLANSMDTWFALHFFLAAKKTVHATLNGVPKVDVFRLPLAEQRDKLRAWHILDNHTSTEPHYTTQKSASAS